MPNDPKQIWKNQPEEQPKMTLEVIHYKAVQLHKRTQRELIGNIAVPVVLVVLSGFGIGFAGHPLQQTVYALVIAWALAGQFFLHRGMWEGAPGPWIDLYRREIERRRNLFRRTLQWGLGPVAVAIAAFIIPLVSAAYARGLLHNTVPFFLLLVIWVVGVFVIRTQGLRELRRELDELNRLESYSGAGSNNPNE